LPCDFLRRHKEGRAVLEQRKDGYRGELLREEKGGGGVLYAFQTPLSAG